METKILEPNTIAAVSNSSITNATGLYDDSNAPTPVFTINLTHQTHEAEPDPTPEAEPYDEYYEDCGDDNGKVKEAELP